MRLHRLVCCSGVAIWRITQETRKAYLGLEIQLMLILHRKGSCFSFKSQCESEAGSKKKKGFFPFKHDSEAR